MEIVVPSTTHYSDAWNPFCELFKKYWPNCQFPVRLITDTKTDPWGFDDPIIMGQDFGWSANFHQGLQRIEAEFVLLMQEDFWLNAPVDHAYVTMALKKMLDDDSIACFRLYPCPGPDVNIGPRIGLITPGSSYRVSCQAAIWRKTDLIELLSKFSSPRTFEIDGTNFVNSERTNRKYLSVMESDPNKWVLQYYCTAIGRGLWDEAALEFAKKEGIQVDLSRRGVWRPS